MTSQKFGVPALDQRHFDRREMLKRTAILTGMAMLSTACEAPAVSEARAEPAAGQTAASAQETAVAETTTTQIATALRRAIERKDQAAYTALLDEEIQFFGPTEAEPFVGREIVGQLLGMVFGIFEDFRYIDQVDGDGLHVLVFRARVGEEEAEGVDLLRINAEGLVSEFTVIVRPLATLVALSKEVGARMDAAFPNDEDGR